MVLNFPLFPSLFLCIPQVSPQNLWLFQNLHFAHHAYFLSLLFLPQAIIPNFPGLFTIFLLSYFFHSLVSSVSKWWSFFNCYFIVVCYNQNKVNFYAWTFDTQFFFQSNSSAHQYFSKVFQHLFDWFQQN